MKIAAPLLFFVLSLLMNVPWLGMTPLSGTEGHRALTANQMVHSGQWLVPVLYGRAYLAKPPMHHWLIAISESIAGRESLFAWRMPSAIEGALLCAAACYFGMRWFGRDAGLVSGGIALGMVALWGEHQVADIDATDTLAATLAAFFALEALFGKTRHRAAWIIAAGTAGGATWMTKGPAGLPIIVAIAVFPAICELRRKNVGRALPAVASKPSPPLPVLRGRAGVGADWNADANSPHPNPPPEYREREQDAQHRDYPGKKSAGIARPTWIRCLGRSKNPAVWVPLLIGAGIFAIYAVSVLFELRRLGLHPDFSGLNESVQTLHPNTLDRVANALKVPPTVFIYALPASVALPLSFWRPIRRAIGDGRQRRMAGALAWVVLISWAICLLSGMINPRYAYPTIGVLCPLAGVIAVAGARAGGDPAHWVRGTAIVSAVGLAIAGAVLSISAWKLTHLTTAHLTMPLVLCSLVSITVAILTARQVRHSWRPAWGLVLLTLILSVPFSLQRAYARERESGKQVANTIGRLVGSGRVAMGEGLTFKPEIFYYAHVPTTAYLADEYDCDHVPPGTWLFIRDDEYAKWDKRVGNRLKHTRLITFPSSGGPWAYYLTWFAPP